MFFFWWLEVQWSPEGVEGLLYLFIFSQQPVQTLLLLQSHTMEFNEKTHYPANHGPLDGIRQKSQRSKKKLS